MSHEEEYKNGFEEGTINSRLGRIERDVEKYIGSMNLISKIGVGVLVGIGVWVGTIQTRQLRSVDDVMGIERKVDLISERQQKSDVTSAEINTKLISIESTLQEIKASLK